MYIEKIKFKNFIVLIKANDEYLVSIDITNLNSIQEKSNHITKTTKIELEKYFNGEKYDFSKIKLNLNEHTIFRQNVLNQLKKIPYGTTVTYKELANSLNSKAFMAVGTALSKNPYLIILPCHRVIRSDTSIGNFTCAVDGIKEYLLNLEKEYLSNKYRE